MVTPKQLDFSSSGCDANDSDDTFSRRNSPRNPSSNAAEAKEETKTKISKKRLKKKTTKKKTKTKNPGSSIINRIWNEEDELIVLKGLVDYRAKTGHQSKTDWDALYRFVGGSIVVKFTKEQVLGKIRKLKTRFLNHWERINRGDDPCFTRSSDSEAFGFSMMIWGQIDDDNGMDKEMLNEHEEHVNDNGIAEITGNGTARKARQSENVEELVKEHEEVANVEVVNDNGIAEMTRTARKARQSENVEELVKEHEEVVNDNGIPEMTRTARKARQRESREELVKEHEEVANIEVVNDNGAMKVTCNGTARNAQQRRNGKELEEVANLEPVYNGAAKITKSRIARKALQSRNGKEVVKELEEVANVEPVNNGAAKITKNGTTRKAHRSQNGVEMVEEHEEVVANVNGTDGNESHEDENDDVFAVQDAFETMMSQGLSDYQKKFHLEKLMNIGTGKRRELSDEWKALCVEERRLHVKKLRFSAKLAETANES